MRNRLSSVNRSCHGSCGSRSRAGGSSPGTSSPATRPGTASSRQVSSWSAWGRSARISVNSGSGTPKGTVGDACSSRWLSSACAGAAVSSRAQAVAATAADALQTTGVPSTRVDHCPCYIGCDDDRPVLGRGLHQQWTRSANRVLVSSAACGHSQGVGFDVGQVEELGDPGVRSGAVLRLQADQGAVDRFEPVAAENRFRR